jgi:hypothetical protein
MTTLPLTLSADSPKNLQFSDGGTHEVTVLYVLGIGGARYGGNVDVLR